MLNIFIKLLLKLICILPHKISLSFGRFLGFLLWLFSWKKVDICESRCVASLGTGITNARLIVKNSFKNIGMSAIEFVRLKNIVPEIESYVSFSEGSQEILREALSRGRGVILMTSHIDNWELAGARLVEEGFKLTPIYTPQKNEGGIEDFIFNQRSNIAKMKMVKSEGGALREIFKSLRAGEILVILQDLDARKEGIILNFLGIPASTHEGIVKLYNKFKSPVVPAVCLRDEKNKTHHKIIIKDILSDEKDKNGNPFGEDLKGSLEMCNKVIEGWVKNNPEQWLWLIDRWEYTFRHYIKR